MAVQGVLSNRLRSLLTMLGITIGVAAVIILVAVGHGSAVAVSNRIEALGTNVVTIQPGGFGFGRGSGGFRSSFTQLTMKDVKALQDPTAAPDIKSVTPVVIGLRHGDVRRRELLAEPVRRHDARRTKRRASRRSRRARSSRRRRSPSTPASSCSARRSC